MINEAWSIFLFLKTGFNLRNHHKNVQIKIGINVVLGVYYF